MNYRIFYRDPQHPYGSEKYIQTVDVTEREYFSIIGTSEEIIVIKRLSFAFSRRNFEKAEPVVVSEAKEEAIRREQATGLKIEWLSFLSSDEKKLLKEKTGALYLRSGQE